MTKIRSFALGMALGLGAFAGLFTTLASAAEPAKTCVAAVPAIAEARQAGYSVLLVRDEYAGSWVSEIQKLPAAHGKTLVAAHVVVILIAEDADGVQHGAAIMVDADGCMGDAVLVSTTDLKAMSAAIQAKRGPST